MLAAANPISGAFRRPRSVESRALDYRDPLRSNLGWRSWLEVAPTPGCFSKLAQLLGRVLVALAKSPGLNAFNDRGSPSSGAGDDGAIV